MNRPDFAGGSASRAAWGATLEPLGNAAPAEHEVLLDERLQVRRSGSDSTERVSGVSGAVQPRNRTGTEGASWNTVPQAI